MIDPKGTVASSHRVLGTRALTSVELSSLEANQLWLESACKVGASPDFSGHDFHGANLSKRNLQKMNFAGADLGDADLSGADLRGANLAGADLSGADLCGANCRGATMREAILSDADLRSASGLLPAQLAGTVLVGAKLPEELRDFKSLKAVEDAAEYSRTILITMLAGCAYSWLTIATTTDARLVSNTSSSPLPILTATIPIVGFYVAGPLLLLAVYTYFHINLQRMWEQLADCPAILPDGRPLDKAVDPWLPVGIVRSHMRHLKCERLPLFRAQSFLSGLFEWWVVPFTVFWFWLRYLTRQDWWGSLLHIVLLDFSILFAVYLQLLTRHTLRGEGVKSRRQKVVVAAAVFGMFVVTASILFTLSAGVIGINFERYENSTPRLVWAVARHLGLKPASPGLVKFTSTVAFSYTIPFHSVMKNFSPSPTPLDPQSWVPITFKFVGYLPYADLYEAELSTKPPNWARKDDQMPLVAGAHLPTAHLRFARAARSFLVNADLTYADLTGASFWMADLTGADLGYASMMGADLSYVCLHKADLDGANLTGATLNDSDLTAASLRIAQLQSSYFLGADLKEADFEKADLIGAQLTNADLRFAKHLTSAQVLSTRDWERALLPDYLLGQPGIAPDHNKHALEAIKALVNQVSYSKPNWLSKEEQELESRTKK